MARNTCMRSSSSDCVRVSEVFQNRHEKPVICSGMRELRVLITAVFFHWLCRRWVGYRTLPYSEDRIFSSVIAANWWYNASEGFDFDKTWAEVKETIMEGFAGPAETGVHSADVENTLLKTTKTAISRIPLVNLSL